jgi:hypothetical protein
VRFGGAIDARFGEAVNFAETCSVPVRIGLTRVRGFRRTRDVAACACRMRAQILDCHGVCAGQASSRTGLENR